MNLYTTKKNVRPWEGQTHQNKTKNQLYFNNND
jgi:hypothetical protein